MNLEIEQIYEKFGKDCPYSIPDGLDYYIFPSVPAVLFYNRCSLREKINTDTREPFYAICTKENHFLCELYLKEKSLEGEIKNDGSI